MQSAVRRLRAASIVEAISYLALLAATVAKYAGWGDMGVTLLGPVHGIIYLGYVAIVAVLFRAVGWVPMRALMAVVVAALPFGGFFVERHWLTAVNVR